MKKTVSIITALILAISLTSAAEITGGPTDSNITIEPGQYGSASYTIDSLDENESDVSLDIQSDKFSVTPDPLPPYSEGDVVNFQLTTSQSNISEQINFTFQYDDNGTAETIEKSFTANSIIPYRTFEETPAWINQSYQLNVNGKELNVSNIETNLYFNNNSVTLSDKKTINDVRLTLMDIIPGEYAKIKAETKKDNASFSIKQLEQQEQQEQQQCKLGIKTITTMQRGSSFAIETVNQNSDDNEVIGGVSVTLIDSGKGEPIGNDESGSSGYASLYIPEDAKGPIVARLGKSDSDCKANNQQVSFNRPYNVYIEETDQFQLSLQLENGTFYTNVSGTVKNKEGSTVGTGIVQITKPNGQETDVAFNKTGFVFKPSEAGQYSFQATKEGYVDSSEVTATYVADQDNDGIPNSQDQCLETEGVEANNGCPKQDVYFEVYKDGETYNGDIRPNTGYTIKILNRNRSVVNYTGEIPLAGSSTDIPFENGVSQNGETQTIMFNETGEYGLELNTSAYEPATQNLMVENKSPLSGVPIVLVGIVVIILGGLGLILYAASQSSGSSKSSASQTGGEFGYDMSQLGEGDK